MNNVSIYGIVTTNNRQYTLTSSSPPLIFDSWCLLDKNPPVVSQHIWHPFSTVFLFNLGNILMELVTMFNGHGSLVFRKKFQM